MESWSGIMAGQSRETGAGLAKCCVAVHSGISSFLFGSFCHMILLSFTDVRSFEVFVRAKLTRFNGRILGPHVNLSEPLPNQRRRFLVSHGYLPKWLLSLNPIMLLKVCR